MAYSLKDRPPELAASQFSAAPDFLWSFRGAFIVQSGPSCTDKETGAGSNGGRGGWGAHATSKIQCGMRAYVPSLKFMTVEGLRFGVQRSKRALAAQPPGTNKLLSVAAKVLIPTRAPIWR
jgi:hypothetical protein